MVAIFEPRPPLAAAAAAASTSIALDAESAMNQLLNDHTSLCRRDTLRLLAVLRASSPAGPHSLLWPIAASLTNDDDDVAAMVIRVLAEQSAPFDADLWLRLLPLAPQLSGAAALTALLDAGALVVAATQDQLQQIYGFASNLVRSTGGIVSSCLTSFAVVS